VPLIMGEDRAVGHQVPRRPSVGQPAVYPRYAVLGATLRMYGTYLRKYRMAEVGVVFNTVVADPKHFGTDPDPDFDIKAFRILYLFKHVWKACVLKIFNVHKNTLCCIFTCLNLSKLMC
jgi:hypothetical protein